MKTYLLGLLLSLTSLASATTDPSNMYTVVANSGLSMRNEPDINANRTAIIPFGEQIELLTDEPYKQETEKINGRTGFWADVRYKDKEGYVFSAYLWPGSLTRPQSDYYNLDSNYRIMATGMRCENLDYHPDLNWYGWFVNHEASDEPILTLRPVSFTVKMGDDNKYYENDGPFCEILYVEHTDEETYPMLTIGTTAELPYQQLNKHSTTYHDDPQYYSPFGWLPYPYQRTPIATIGTSTYYLEGQDTHFFHEELQQAMTRYELHLGPYRSNPYDEYREDHQSLSPLLYTSDYEEDYYLEDGRSYLYHPKIVWQADINNDQFPDLLFHRPNTLESCGGSEEYFLLLSRKTPSGEFTYEKVAEDFISDCM